MSKCRRSGPAVVLVSLFGIAVAAAQSLALDPLRLAPHIYENVLENEHVRVLKVTDRNGQTTPLHAHPDRVAVFLSPCAWMEESKSGDRQMQSFRLGDVIWLDRETHGGVTSAVIQECSLLEIELK